MDMNTVCRVEDGCPLVADWLSVFVFCFAFPVKNGCVVFDISSILAMQSSFAFLPLLFGGVGGNNILPSRIWVILSPISFRLASSRPYFMHTIRDGGLLDLGFGGDPNVPVFGFHFSTLPLTLGFVLLEGLDCGVASVGFINAILNGSGSGLVKTDSFSLTPRLCSIVAFELLEAASQWRFRRGLFGTGASCGRDASAFRRLLLFGTSGTG